MNQYYSDKVPVGFNHFFGLHGNSKYYNYTLNENGKLVEYGDTPDDYLPNVIKSRALNFITNHKAGKPFFAMLSLPSAHAPFTPEAQYADSLKNVTAPRTENFNVAPKPFKKHWLVTMDPKEMSESVIETIDQYHHRRLETLLSVDDLVEEIVLQLNKQKLSDETYIVFTSDNGYHLGQWAMPFDKRLPYETDIRVPLIVRGPNIPYKVVINSPVLLIDLAPTFLNWAKFPIHINDFDGKPFDHLFTHNGAKIEKRQMLIEYWGEVDEENHECHYRKSQRLSGCTLEADCKCQDSWNNTYACVRHIEDDTNLIFCVFRDRNGYQEAYDLNDDLYQVNNIGYELLPSVQARYQLIIENLRRCKGDDCRVFRNV